jgi:hypothetical protein
VADNTISHVINKTASTYERNQFGKIFFIAHESVANVHSPGIVSSGQKSTPDGQRGNKRVWKGMVKQQ